jgi:hypothetical protein
MENEKDRYKSRVLNTVGKGLPSDFAERRQSETNFHLLCGHEDHVG